MTKVNLIAKNAQYANLGAVMLLSNRWQIQNMMLFRRTPMHSLFKLC
jgi:hypothetical protein